MPTGRIRFISISSIKKWDTSIFHELKIKEVLQDIGIAPIFMENNVIFFYTADDIYSYI